MRFNKEQIIGNISTIDQDILYSILEELQAIRHSIQSNSSPLTYRESEVIDVVGTLVLPDEIITPKQTRAKPRIPQKKK